VIVAGHFGQLGMTDQLRNVSGFENYLKEAAANVVPVQVRNEDPAAWAKDMERILEREGDISAVYSCSARYTVYLAEFLRRNGLSGKLTAIGSDLFAESLRFLQDGTLSAIIDKKISRQSYLAAKTLFDYAVKGDMPRSDVLMVRPEVLLRNSVSLAEQSDPGSVFDDII
jgi:LacI family transcriptional regulator